MGKNSKKASAKKRSLNCGFDYDLEEDWEPLNPNLYSKDDIRKTIGSCQSLRQTVNNSEQDAEEFNIEGAIFQEKNSSNKKEKKASNAVINDFDEEIVMRDAYGRQIGRRDSLESTWLPGESSPLAASVINSPFSSMSRIQLSTLSSASSSSLAAGSRHRSYSNSERSSASAPLRRNLSAGSVATSSSRMSRLSQSPGLPRKVSNSANMLTTGLAMEKKKKKGGGSRGHSPARHF